MVSQLHALRLELLPGGAKKDLSAAQAKALLAKVRPRDQVGKTRRRLAAELVADLEQIYARKKTADRTRRSEPFRSSLAAPEGPMPVQVQQPGVGRARATVRSTGRCSLSPHSLLRLDTEGSHVRTLNQCSG